MACAATTRTSTGWASPKRTCWPTPWSSGAARTDPASELGREAGRDVRLPRVARRAPHVVLLVEGVHVLDLDLLDLLVGADPLGVEVVHHRPDVLAAVLHLHRAA